MYCVIQYINMYVFNYVQSVLNLGRKFFIQIVFSFTSHYKYYKMNLIQLMIKQSVCVYWPVKKNYIDQYIAEII